jgi:NADPH:quinone reductase
MLPRTQRQWVLAARPEGAVRESDLRLEAAPVPSPAADEVLIRTLYLSVAPVMRRYMLDGAGIEQPLELGEVMRGRGVGEIVASRHPDYAVGDIVHAKLGWREYSVNDASPYFMMYKVRQRQVPVSTAIGVLGITGFTSWVGVVEIGKVRPGETVLVSGAAGGVGSNVGWITRNLGGRAVGMAGTQEKCRLLVERLGYDAAINYREQDVALAIREHCPHGIDVFFDNVGGEILDQALAALRRYGRVVSCGRISQYLQDGSDGYRLANWSVIGSARARMQGFFIYDYQSSFDAAERQMAEWIAAGRMQYLEDVLDGIEQMPRALINLFEGRNVGKQIVKVADRTTSG